VTRRLRIFLRRIENLVEVLRALGRPAEAAACLERNKLWSEDPDELSKLAGEFALCIPLVGKGKTEFTAAEQAERRQYGDQALKVIRQAITHGFKDVEQLKKAPTLDPLRSREDFQELLRALEGRK
jgi:hypothetical protein